MDSCTIDLGDLRATVRTNSEELSGALRDALRSRVVDDPGAPKNFSVALSHTNTDAHLLFWGGCVAARSFDPDRIMQALLHHLTAHRPPPPGLVWVNAVAYVKDGGAILMPGALNDDLRIVDRQLRDAGWISADSPRALVDLPASELVVADLMEPDPAALRRAVEGAPRRRREPTVPLGRYPLERWVFIDYTGHWGPISRANATRAAMLEIQLGIDHPDPALLDTIAGLFRSVRAESMFPGHPQSVLHAVLGQHPPT